MIIKLKKMIPLATILFLCSCEFNKVQMINESPLLKPQEVRTIAKSYLLKIGIKDSEYIIESGPTYYESGFWIIYFDSKEDESTQLGTAFGVSVEDKNKKDVKLLPGM